jgi:hypothetical protein
MNAISYISNHSNSLNNCKFFCEKLIIIIMFIVLFCLNPLETANQLYFILNFPIIFIFAFLLRFRAMTSPHFCKMAHPLFTDLNKFKFWILIYAQIPCMTCSESSWGIDFKCENRAEMKFLLYNDISTNKFFNKKILH